MTGLLRNFEGIRWGYRVRCKRDVGCVYWSCDCSEEDLGLMVVLVVGFDAVGWVSCGIYRRLLSLIVL